MWLRTAALAAMLWSVPVPGWSAVPLCNPLDLMAGRQIVGAACPCDGFPRHSAYMRCVKETVAKRVTQCRADVLAEHRRSTCSRGATQVVCCEQAGVGDHCTIRSKRQCTSRATQTRATCDRVRFCADADCTPAADAGAQCAVCPAQVLFGGEGNRLRRYDLTALKAGTPRNDILIPSHADDPAHGLDINAQICALPDGSGRFIAGEDTGQPHPLQGWGLFAPDGAQLGKLTPTYQGAADNAENYGCGFDGGGRLFLSDVGNQAVGPCDGQLTIWFPPFDRFPGPPGAYPNTDATSTNYCKLAVDLCTAGGIAVDDAGRVYVTEARGPRVTRFLPPFPTGPTPAEGCDGVDATGAPMATHVRRETFIHDTANVFTPTAIVPARNGNWYVSSVFTAIIAEYTPAGAFVRRVVEPAAGDTGFPKAVGHPQGLAVDCAGDLYYADLALRITSTSIGPGPNGTVRWVHFAPDGTPAAPIVLQSGLAFPDGLGILAGTLSPLP